MPIDIQITDTQVIVTAENGTRVALSRHTGVVAPPPASSGQRLRVTRPKVEQVKISPRWIAHVGDTVLGQHKPGGRKFRTTIRAFKVEKGTTYAQVSDPRNGGTYLLALDRLTRTRS